MHWSVHMPQMYKCRVISMHTHLLCDAYHIHRKLVPVITEVAVNQKGWGSHAQHTSHSRRPISSFSHHASVSYAHVERLVLERQLRQTCRFDFVKQVSLLSPPAPCRRGVLLYSHLGAYAVWRP